jgi:hypothetical protein
VFVRLDFGEHFHLVWTQVDDAHEILGDQRTARAIPKDGYFSSFLEAFIKTLKLMEL